MSDLNHIVSVCRHAASIGDTGPLSTGESLAAAIVLNRPDWLADLGYTMTQALSRIGQEWVALLPAASEILANDDRVALAVADGIAKARIRPLVEASDGATASLDYAASLVTYGEAPGCRDVTITADLRELNGTLHGHRLRASLTFNAADSATIAQHILRVHSSAWSRPEGPIDKAQDENRPHWLSPSTPS